MNSQRLLYLIRHGVAGDRGLEYPDDSQRPLTPDGKSRLREIGAGLVALGVELDGILTSPFVRTRQTAEILAGAWTKPPRVIDLEALAVGGRTAHVMTALAADDPGPRVALVGHMPGIGVLASELLGVVRPLDFKKGAVACLALDRAPGRGAASLLWFAPPRLLRLAGR